MQVFTYDNQDSRLILLVRWQEEILKKIKDYQIKCPKDTKLHATKIKTITHTHNTTLQFIRARLYTTKRIITLYTYKEYDTLKRI